MLDIMRIFICLSQRLSTTELRQLTGITEALLAMSGRVTMRGLSRWAGQGGSYRTVQRFFNTVLDWSQLQWLFIRTHLLDDDESGSDSSHVFGSLLRVSSKVAISF